MANQLFSALFAKYPAFEDVRIVLSALFAPCFPFLPDRLLSFPQHGNFIKQFPADNRRMAVRHHPPAFPWIFSDFSIRFIVGDAVIHHAVDAINKELRIYTGFINDTGKELPTIIAFEDILEIGVNMT